MHRIDAHMHLNADDEASRALLAGLDMKLMNICIATPGWRNTMHAWFRGLAHDYPERFAWCTAFDLPEGDELAGGPAAAEYVERVIEGLRTDRADGAVAVKIWKHVGMEVRRADGSYLLVDDPLFDPIFDFLVREQMPVLTHIGEPLACWQPLNPKSPHYSYYRDHPQWHMHGRTDMPSHAELIAARDRVVERRPKLRMIGAHLGSLEHDVREVARRLDAWPNFAVDISARLGDLLIQRRGWVRDFFEAYADRIIYGTDLVYKEPVSGRDEAGRERVHAAVRESYDAYGRFLMEDGPVEFDGIEGRGIGLPTPIVDRVMVANATTWYPGIE